MSIVNTNVLTMLIQSKYFMAKKSNTFRLTDECSELLKKLSDKQGVSQAAIIEILVRDEAKKQKVK